jgi:hypothetical protein
MEGFGQERRRSLAWFDPLMHMLYNVGEFIPSSIAVVDRRRLYGGLGRGFPFPFSGGYSVAK